MPYVDNHSYVKLKFAGNEIWKHNVFLNCNNFYVILNWSFTLKRLKATTHDVDEILLLKKSWVLWKEKKKGNLDLKRNIFACINRAQYEITSRTFRVYITKTQWHRLAWQVGIVWYFETWVGTKWFLKLTII